jgi:hypothetical protein
MCIRTLAIAVLASIAISAEAQSPSADERAIRDLIARYDKGEAVAHTDDRILFGGEDRRPVVGSQRREPVPADVRPAAPVPGSPERVQGSRRRLTTPVRIDIAKSGELAYEFSNSELIFDLKNGDRETIRSSVLRVWKKDDGQWKIAALFARPHYQEAVPPNAK